MIKSNNPHLAGGEKQKSTLLCLVDTCFTEFHCISLISSVPFFSETTTTQPKR